MNRDTVIGFILIGLVLIGFSWYNQPSAEQLEAMRKEDSIAVVNQEKAKKQQAEEAARKAQAEDAARNDSTSLFFTALNGQNNQVVLKNNKVELTFSTKGGTLSKAVVKDFADKDGNPDVTLFDEKDQQMNFLLAGKQDNIITQDLYFTPSNQSDSTVTMTAQATGGGSIVLDYRLGPDHLLHFSLTANGLSGIFSPTYKEMDVEWSDHSRQQEKGFYFENRYTGLFYKEANDGSTDNLSETADKRETIDEQLDWVAFRNQFFSVALVSKDNFAGGAQLSSVQDQKESGYLKQFDARLKTAFDPTGQKPSEFEMYIGPNDFRLIQDVEKQSRFGKDLDLEQLVNLGWWLFRLINRWFTLYVFDWLASWGFPMGIVLILITLILKAITFPMVTKQAAAKQYIDKKEIRRLIVVLTLFILHVIS